MKKEDSNKILDNILENGFDAEPVISSVPMVIKDTKVPAEISEDIKVVRNNLYSVNDKLSSVLDYLVNNLDNAEQAAAGAFVKKSPIDEINDIAKAIVFVNQQILKNTNDQLKAPRNPNIPNTQNNTQNNFFVSSDRKKFSLKDVDDMLKVNGDKNVN